MKNDLATKKNLSKIILNEVIKKLIEKSFAEGSDKHLINKSIDTEVKFNIAKWNRIIQRRLRRVFLRVIEANGGAAMEKLKYQIKGEVVKKAFPDSADSLLEEIENLALRFDVLDPNVLQFVEDRLFRFSFEINDFTQRGLKDELIKAFEEGESIDQIKRRVKRVLGFSDDSTGNYRAQRIVRSEVIRASNYAQEQAYIQSGVVEGKEWFTALDERTCPACGALDGRIIGLGKNYFNKGDTFHGFSLNYEDIKAPPLHPNCRCTLLPVIIDRYLPKGVLKAEKK